MTLSTSEDKLSYVLKQCVALHAVVTKKAKGEIYVPPPFHCKRRAVKPVPALFFASFSKVAMGIFRPAALGEGEGILLRLFLPCFWSEDVLNVLANLTGQPHSRQFGGLLFLFKKIYTWISPFFYESVEMEACQQSIHHVLA